MVAIRSTRQAGITSGSCARTYTQVSSGNPADLGLMIAAFGAGSFGGAAAFGVLGHRLPRRATWLAAFLVSPLIFWVLALAPPPPRWPGCWRSAASSAAGSI